MARPKMLVPNCRLYLERNAANLGAPKETSPEPARQRHRAPWVMLHNVPGADSEVRAKVIDVSDGGIGVELACALQENSFIVVHGLPGNSGPNGKIGARVVRCHVTAEGFQAGLAPRKHGNAQTSRRKRYPTTTKCCRSARCGSRHDPSRVSHAGATLPSGQ